MQKSKWATPEEEKGATESRVGIITGFGQTPPLHIITKIITTGLLYSITGKAYEVLVTFAQPPGLNRLLDQAGGTGLWLDGARLTVEIAPYPKQVVMPKKASDAIFDQGVTRVMSLSRVVTGRLEPVCFTVKDLQSMAGAIHVSKVAGSHLDSKIRETMIVQFTSIEHCMIARDKISTNKKYAGWAPACSQDPCGTLEKESSAASSTTLSPNALPTFVPHSTALEQVAASQASHQSKVDACHGTVCTGPDLIDLGDSDELWESVTSPPQTPAVEDSVKEDAVNPGVDDVVQGIGKLSTSESVRQPTDFFPGFGAPDRSSKPVPNFAGIGRSKHASEEVQKKAKEEEL